MYEGFALLDEDDAGGVLLFLVVGLPDDLRFRFTDEGGVIGLRSDDVDLLDVRASACREAKFSENKKKTMSFSCIKF